MTNFANHKVHIPEIKFLIETKWRSIKPEKEWFEFQMN